MKAIKDMDEFELAIEEADRLLAKYEQQDATAHRCGYSSYYEMPLFDSEYFGLACTAQRYPKLIQLHPIFDLH